MIDGSKFALKFNPISLLFSLSMFKYSNIDEINVTRCFFSHNYQKKKKYINRVAWKCCNGFICVNVPLMTVNCNWPSDLKNQTQPNVKMTDEVINTRNLIHFFLLFTVFTLGVAMHFSSICALNIKISGLSQSNDG